jgi:hypothetical protein
MKTLKQFAADHFTGGIKTNTGNAAKQTAATVLDNAARAAKHGGTRPDNSAICAARILRKGGYIGHGHGVLTAWMHL